MEPKNPNIDEQGDYIFRFKIDKREDKGKDLRIEYIRVTLEKLLDMITLYYRGEKVKVDSFKLEGFPETYRIFPPNS